MKKLLTILLIGVMALGLYGCGSSNNQTTTTKEKSKTMVLAKEDYDKLYSNPSDYKGYEVDFYGKIFTDVERDNKGTYLQVFADAKNSGKNTIVAINDPNLDVKEKDIVHIIGIVRDKFEGENAFGAKLTSPIVDAITIEKASYAEAFAPTKFTLYVPNGKKTQHGYIMDIKKVEFAEDETRIYVKITNKSKNKISFYDFNSKLIQGTKQYETKDNYDADYPEVQSEILPDVSSEGIVLYPAVNLKANKMKLILEGSSDDYMQDFKPFVYNLTWEDQ